MFLLAHCVETYIELKEDEEIEYEHLVRQQENEEVMRMEQTWAEKLEARGEARGAQAMRQLLERLLVRRFGPLPEGVLQRLNSVHSLEELSRLSDRVLTATSLEETGLLP